MIPERAKLHIILSFLQFCHAGNHVFLRIALNMSVSKLVFPVYRNTVALLLLGPLAYFSEKYAVYLCYIQELLQYCIRFFIFLICSSQKPKATTDHFLCNTILPGRTCWVRFLHEAVPFINLLTSHISEFFKSLFSLWQDNNERRILPCGFRKHITNICFSNAEFCSGSNFFHSCCIQASYN